VGSILRHLVATAVFEFCPLELIDGLEDLQGLAGVEAFVAMEGGQEVALVEHPPIGQLGIAGEEGAGVGFEAVAEGPIHFAVAGGEDEAVVEFAEGGVGDAGGIAAGAGFVGGGGFRGHAEFAGVEVVLAGVLGGLAFAFRGAGAGGFEGVGAIGGEAAFRDLG
jgi:hypothetical protein